MERKCWCEVVRWFKRSSVRCLKVFVFLVERQWMFCSRESSGRGSSDVR